MEDKKENKELERPKELQENGQREEQAEPQGQHAEEGSGPQESEENLGVQREEKKGASEKDEHWDADLDIYPLREPDEDARWASRTVKIWIGFALCAIVFILTLLLLGTVYA